MDTYGKVCELIALADQAADCLYRQDSFHAAQYNQKIAGSLPDLFRQRDADTDAKGAVSDAFCSEVLPVMKALLAYQEAGDEIGAADVYAMQLKPLLSAERDRMRAGGCWREPVDYYEKNRMAADGQICRMLEENDIGTEDIPDCYQLLETAVGSFTLRVEGKDGTGRLMASMDNPYREARQLADAYCGEHTRNCILFGLGMGYLAAALQQRENLEHIRIFEQDPYVIKAAFHYVDLTKLLLAGTVQIYCDPQLSAFSKALSEMDGERETLLIHRPSMEVIAHQVLRERVRDFFLHDCSVRSQRRLLEANFYKNTDAAAMRETRMLWELREVFAGRNVLLVAGGPSAERQLPFLASCSREYQITTYSSHEVQCRALSKLCAANGSDGGAETYLVVCVGTVLRYLLEAGVKPDFVVMTDAQENMVQQIAGLDTEPLSLIYLSTLYYEVPKRWQGKKYIGFQRGFMPAERMERQEERLFETGGSVATFALDCLLRFGCKRVVCIGLDLAYTDNRRHAGERAEVSGNLHSENNMREVVSVDGTKVWTGSNLDNYRLWIERRIQNRTPEEQEVELINASGGAYINGMNNNPCFFEELSKR